MAVLSFPDFSSPAKNEKKINEMLEVLKNRGIKIEGETFLMRYNPPGPFRPCEEMSSSERHSLDSLMPNFALGKCEKLIGFYPTLTKILSPSSLTA